MFQIGQKVVCVDTSRNTHPSAAKPGEYTPLVKGAVYVIRDIDSRASDAGLHPEPTVRLEGVFGKIVRHKVFGDYEIGYRMSRFAPVKTTNIDVFLNMLAPAPSEMERV